MAQRGEVLVTIMNNLLDMSLAREQHWYRIPVSSVHKWLKERWPPEWLAFYQTKAFGDEAYAVRYYARVLSVQRTFRYELFPNQPRDERSERPYYQLILEPLRQLPQPILSRRWRRIVFIPTTWVKLHAAVEINDLYDESPLEDRLWAALKRLQIPAERQEYVRIADRNYALDFAIYCTAGKIDVETDGDTWHSDPARIPLDNLRDNDLETVGWRVLRFNTTHIREQMQGYCLPTVVENINRLGGAEEGQLAGRRFDLHAPRGYQQLLLDDPHTETEEAQAKIRSLHGEKSRVNSQEILAAAPERIRQHRTAEVELRLVDESGQPQPNLQARVRLACHEFGFGCNAFLLGRGAQDALQRAYEERFTALLNYATLPFYWGHYERTPGVTDERRLHRMAEWCAHHQIPAKGHPLVWHEVFPAWASDYSDDEMLARLETRVHEIVSQFRGSVDIWDVVNEATVSHRFDNAVGRWIADRGAAACVAQALRWAREANPSVTLLYNDFNVSADTETLIAELLDRGAPLDVIGIQSHMHKGTWPLERAWQVCERFARFGLPLHWTELTVLSGQLKAADDDDWHARRTNWKSTPQGEIAQAEYGEALYTLLYSHPAVQAITWWDFSDRFSWQGAPSGLIGADMAPKPLYERLLQLVWQEWSTDIHTTSDEQGQVRARCTFGQYQVEATSTSGAPLTGSFDLCREGERTIEVSLQPL